MLRVDARVVIALVGARGQVVAVPSLGSSECCWHSSLPCRARLLFAQGDEDSLGVGAGEELGSDLL